MAGKGNEPAQQPYPECGVIGSTDKPGQKEKEKNLGKALCKEHITRSFSSTMKQNPLYVPGVVIIRNAAMFTFRVHAIATTPSPDDFNNEIYDVINAISVLIFTSSFLPVP